ncbi:MAG TPA: heparan-alpha-glucosaminide N-acetyltransferase domain-containing protein [Polyangiaceae bacterium LLY-WYZ-15_(1-7)]|nr:hypothetical protein [Myxococcales bacterium]MAT29001.1 hypothetical protein [Sandaracinus sp.]HJK94523.1 heparan-alpha-glucosaminide N-acetyltransferase domain-containing protein [Polyangiaceae bacterium LLY-WYZ-15_(1-7)]HJL04228.1 heparan-alpha-glucosaminide N-acetyltransferase domain-containing protein [Polyangiaceae bacterium LLY-WYZ-15_(1-7)]HJL08926.1 heparan-alpha-glucosaminide N-acetyltransferase domain-containing protein [Polyangiaceae bacterium LLY-WYZ-15_(1-7)]
MGRRVEGVDVARGVASLIMIQGHAYHGWVAPAHHDAAYAFTRVLGTLPLPAFLVLAGAAVMWRLDAAVRRGEERPTVRRALVRRGLQVVAYGYAVNLAYALIDGAEGLHTYLRADVLQVIGLSIAAAAALGLRGEGPVDPRAFVRRNLLLGAAVTLACPALARLGPHVPEALAPLVAPVVDVAPYTRMPFVPLFAWLAFGAAAGAWLLARRDGTPASRRAGTRPSALLALGALGLALALAGHYGTPALVDALGGTLSRRHPAVWLNVLDLAGRGLLVLAAGAGLSLALPAAPRRALVRLGRGSLVAYVLHVPFCYGVLGGDLVGGADMARATLWLGPLIAFSWGAVYVRDALRDRLARRAVA